MNKVFGDAFNDEILIMTFFFVLIFIFEEILLDVEKKRTID
jgi:uncharacterized membrane protein